MCITYRLYTKRAFRCQGTALASPPPSEAQDDRLHLYAIGARSERDAILTPQRELQPLQAAQPRAVRRATPPRRGPHPVVPFAGKPLWKQDATPDMEGRERHRPLAPGAVHRAGYAPARAVLLHQRAVHALVR